MPKKFMAGISRCFRLGVTWYEQGAAWGLLWYDCWGCRQKGGRGMLLGLCPH